MSRSVKYVVLRAMVGGALAVAAVSCSSDAGDTVGGVDSAAEATTAEASTPVETLAPDDSAAVAETQPAVSEAPEASAAPAAPVTEPGQPFVDAAWTEVAGDETCRCAGGDPWKMWVREANPSKVVLFFEGGGACFSAEMCGPASQSYDRTVDESDNPTGAGGIFDFANAENPLADWSFVFVPYCTGDVHIGDNTNDYGDGLIIEHNGMPNGLFALDQLVNRFGSASEIFVTGSSAGGVPSPLFGALAADRLPDAAVTALADGSGAYPSSPGINSAIGALWGTFDARPSWPEAADLTPEQWSIPGLFVVGGTHRPDVVMARHDHAFDAVQSQFSAIAGIDASELDTLIDGNAAEIEAGGVPMATYVAAGTDHTILGRDEMYTQITDGTRFVDWLTALVERRPVDDVHCTVCT